MKPGQIAKEVILHILVSEGIRGDSIIKSFRKVAESAIASGAKFDLREAGYFVRDMLEVEGEAGMLLSDADAFRIGSEILKHILRHSYNPRLTFLTSAWKVSDIDSEDVKLFADRVWPEDQT